MKQKPELLLPAGNAQSFYAAIEGGADAVYLGLKQFNARGRASNFSLEELAGAVGFAHHRRVNVYLTLNTVVKNSETGEILQLLATLNQISIDAIIIQDWGIYYLAKKYFPRLNLHASTQMANHNSLGTHYSGKKGFDRVVLARELTVAELLSISRSSPVPLEVFIHGALCYSFSGMCLFSSYVGGRGANRGMCAQPCRHNYSSQENHKTFFSLNDNQQLNNLQKIIDFGITSLKVEGRMKLAGYVYQVAKAYRLAIDQPERLDEARQMLEMDFAREKTSYFLGGNISNALSTTTATGIPVGTVELVEGSYFYIRTSSDIKQGQKIRVQSPTRDSRILITVSGFKVVDGLVRIKTEKEQPETGDHVYLAGMDEKRFPTAIEPSKSRIRYPAKNELDKIADEIRFQPKKQEKEKLFARISSPEWLKHIRINDLDRLILSLTKQGWAAFQPDADFIQANLSKISVELPGFIAEKSVEYYRNLLVRLDRAGIKSCVLSHLSQKLIVPDGWAVFTNENVYAFNDAAACAILDEGITNLIFPLENDFENLKNGTYRDGIVPLYFYPKLFYSRMPVKAGTFRNDDRKQFRQLTREGMTIVIPEIPVSIIQNKKQLIKEGFSNFLIDLSFDNPSKNRFKTLITKFRNSELLQPSTGFNFKSGMK